MQLTLVLFFRLTTNLPEGVYESVVNPLSPLPFLSDMLFSFLDVKLLKHDEILVGVFSHLSLAISVYVLDLRIHCQVFTQP